MHVLTIFSVGNRSTITKIFFNGANLAGNCNLTAVDQCCPELQLAYISPPSVEGKLINLCMSYRLEMKLFFILKLVANRGFRL
jgi:hypothetical protein